MVTWGQIDTEKCQKSAITTDNLVSNLRTRSARTPTIKRVGYLKDGDNFMVVRGGIEDDLQEKELQAAGVTTNREHRPIYRITDDSLPPMVVRGAIYGDHHILLNIQQAQDAIRNKLPPTEEIYPNNKPPRFLRNSDHHPHEEIDVKKLCAEQIAIYGIYPKFQGLGFDDDEFTIATGRDEWRLVETNMASQGTGGVCSRTWEVRGGEYWQEEFTVDNKGRETPVRLTMADDSFLSLINRQYLS